MGISHINELSEPSEPLSTGNALVNTGAVIAVLMGVPCFFIGVYGVAGVVTGEQLVAGFFGAIWSYMAVVGAYELNRRRFNWSRGSNHSDQHLLAGTIAVAIGLAISGAIHETMPVLAMIPALAAMKQASDGHDTKTLSWIHGGLLAAGLGVGIWFYRDGIIGQTLLQIVVELP